MTEKGYKNIIFVSIGTGKHGYKHIDIAKNVVIRLKELVNKYNLAGVASWRWGFETPESWQVINETLNKK